ncbi:tripartite motif-containing protein 12A-like isoform X2 [Petromyzon marinus]
MAAAAAAGGRDRGLEEELTCSICLHLYVDPVLLGCPHTFCRECIVSVWRDGACACPECRRVLPFGSKEEMRKQLEKNFKLASIVDRFSSLSTEGERPLKELNPSLARVRLLNLDLCAQHGKALDMFCREHGAFVCADCVTSGAHQGHKLMSAEEVGRQAKVRCSERDDRVVMVVVVVMMVVVVMVVVAMVMVVVVVMLVPDSKAMVSSAMWAGRIYIGHSPHRVCSHHSIQSVL